MATLSSQESVAAPPAGSRSSLVDAVARPSCKIGAVLPADTFYLEHRNLSIKKTQHICFGKSSVQEKKNY